MGNKYGVAINGRMEAFYDSMGEAARHKASKIKKPEPIVTDYKPAKAREVPEIPMSISEEFAVNPPYEMARDSENN